MYGKEESHLRDPRDFLMTEISRSFQVYNMKSIMLYFNSTSKLVNIQERLTNPLYTVALLFNAAGQQTGPEGCFFKDKLDICTLKHLW